MLVGAGMMLTFIVVLPSAPIAFIGGLLYGEAEWKLLQKGKWTSMDEITIKVMYEPREVDSLTLLRILRNQRGVKRAVEVEGE